MDKVERIAKVYVDAVNKYIDVDQAYIYNSYDKESINIAIFSDDFEESKLAKSMVILFSLIENYERLTIEPMGFTRRDIEKKNPFVKEILATGKRIY